MTDVVVILVVVEVEVVVLLYVEIVKYVVVVVVVLEEVTESTVVVVVLEVVNELIVGRTKNIATGIREISKIIEMVMTIFLLSEKIKIVTLTLMF